MVARADARSRWRAFVLLALVTIVGLGAGLAAINSAGRTQDAYDRFVERNAVADVVVNPGLSTTDIDAAIRSLPHVNKVTSSAFLFGGIKRPGPVTLAQLNASIPTEMHGSSDGRFASVDRPAVVAGRLPTGTKEIALTVDYRPAAEKELGRHVGLGETVPVEFFKSPVVEDAADPEVADRPIKPIGIEQLRVVGFVNLADEVLADGLFPRLRVIVSPDVTKRYDCLPAITPTMDEATLFAAMLPDDCALQYRYYAIDVDETANVAAVTAELGRRATKLNRTLPRFLRDNDFNYFLIPTTSADEQRRIDDAIRPTVVALALFGALAAIATLAVVMLVAIRLIRRSERIDDTIRSLGAGRRDRALAIGLPLYATGAFGAFGALMVAWLVSPRSVVGEVRRIDPRPAFGFDTFVVSAAFVAFVALFVLTVVAATFAATHRSPRHRRTRTSSGLPVPTAVSPAFSEGIRAATGAGDNTPSRLLVAACAIAVTVGVTAAVFGANLARLVDEPDRYGWPWEFAALAGFGYGEAAVTTIESDLESHPDVRQWSYAALASDGSIRGETVPTILSEAGPRAIRPWVRSGRLPMTAGEMALGAGTAHDLGIELGDTLTTENMFGSYEGKVVGIVVLPAIGPFLSDRSGPGIGAYVLAPAGSLYKGSNPIGHLVSFVGVDLVEGSNPDSLLPTTDPRLKRWDESGSPPFVFTKAVQPPSIHNVASTRNSPLLLTIVLAFALFLALGLSIGLSVSERRRDFAMLRALGFTRRQVRTSVRVQAVTMTLVGLIVGIPLGIAAGRQSWKAFANQLGVANDATVPALALVLIAVVALIAAMISAAIPAARAARIHPAVELHSQ